MNKLYIYALIVFGIILTACSDVIDVDVPIAAPRLVVEASIDWEKGTLGNEQSIALSISTPYFNSNTIENATGATVTVMNETEGSIFNFIDQNDGTYINNNFLPIIGESYQLKVIYNNETYIATETLTSVTDIKSIYQSTENGFDKDALEVNVVYSDPIGIDNYYLFKFQKEGDLLAELQDISDEFTDGNDINMFHERLEDESINQLEFAPGDVVDIKFYGISEQYFNYIQLLISQNEGGGPFSATPVALRGNCTNPSNPDNYAFGYFRLTQVVKEKYTFQ